MSNKRKKYSADYKAKVALAPIKNEETTAESWPNGLGFTRPLSPHGFAG